MVEEAKQPASRVTTRCTSASKDPMMFAGQVSRHSADCRCLTHLTRVHGPRGIEIADIEVNGVVITHMSLWYVL
jgi:hypothetical protein